jgi:hypothetical protein
MAKAYKGVANENAVLRVFEKVETMFACIMMRGWSAIAQCGACAVFLTLAEACGGV